MIIDYPETLLKIDKKTTINLSYIDIKSSNYILIILY